jgi:MFS family permease
MSERDSPLQASVLRTESPNSSPSLFFFLQVCAAWPVGVVGIAVGNSLVKVGMDVRHSATVIAASTLPYSLEFLLAPIVDSSLTRRLWYIGGVTVMCLCLLLLLIAPWNVEALPLLAGLAFVSASGAAISAVAVKGIMAYAVPKTRLGLASGFLIAGSACAKAVGGGGTLWLLTHLSQRSYAAGLSVGIAALAGTAIVFASPGHQSLLGHLAGHRQGRRFDEGSRPVVAGELLRRVPRSRRGIHSRSGRNSRNAAIRRWSGSDWLCGIDHCIQVSEVARAQDRHRRFHAEVRTPTY